MDKTFFVEECSPNMVDFSLSLLPGDRVSLKDKNGNILLSFQSNRSAFVCVNFSTFPYGLVQRDSDS